MNQGVEVNELV